MAGDGSHLDDYRREVTQQPRKAQHIKQRYNVEVPDRISDTVCLHHYTYNEVDYEWRDHRNALKGFEEVMANGGNCEEQCVLLASLLESVPRVETRFTVVKSRTQSDHTFLQVCFPGSDDETVRSRVAELYESHPHELMPYYPDTFYWETDSEGEHWFTCDPEHSRWLGDHETLFNSGWAVETSDGWHWQEIRYRE
jgi:hypothetical protein